MYPLYFMIGWLAPLGVLVCFLLVCDVGLLGKGLVLLLFAATYMVQVCVASEAIPLVAPVAQPLVWMVVRVCFAVVLLMWIKVDALMLRA